jgi:enoyl-CoA hydratase
MAYENIIYHKENGIAKVILNRPAVKNALNPPLLVEAKLAVEDASKDDSVGVIILSGAGGVFSAGVDLTYLGELKLVGGGVGPTIDIPGLALVKAIQDSPKVVIAMIDGFCFTGGMELALCCDLLVTSVEAKFGDTHVRWGVRPSWGLTQRLPRAVGIFKAKELSFTAATITGQEAYNIGLVNMAVPADKLEETVMALAKKILANSKDAIAAYKYLYTAGQKGTLEQGTELEAKSVFEIRDTEERIKQFRKKG